MRYWLAWLLGGALLVGCADEGGGSAGSGGSNGAGGVAGDGGAGGVVSAEPTRAYVAVLPIPPCQAEAESSYTVDNILEGPGSLESSFPDCAKVPNGAGFTIMCPMDEDGIRYMVTLDRSGANDVRTSGRIGTCTGFLLRDVVAARDEVVVDIFVAPLPPCEEGVMSDYSIDVFIDGSPDPVIVTGEFGNCTGGLDSLRSVITCPNDEASIPYSITIGEGLDWEVTVNGAWETCGGFFSR